MAASRRVVLGTTRLSSIHHEEVVRTAFQQGIRIVDTAASYGGGASENLLGKVIGELPSSTRKEIEIISKFGHYLPSGSSTLSHDISPHFMREELNMSQRRLGITGSNNSTTLLSTDSYSGSLSTRYSFLIDSPERVLQQHIENRNQALRQVAELSAIHANEIHNNNAPVTDSAIPTTSTTLIGLESSSKTRVMSAQRSLDKANKDLNVAKTDLFEKMKETFYQLELEKENGRISNYGICSDALALPNDDPLHLDWMKVLEIQKEVSNQFTCQDKALFIMQFPINVLEPLGAKVAQQLYMHQAGLVGFSGDVKVMGTRPLTAILPLTLNTSTSLSGNGVGDDGQKLEELLAASSGSSTWQRLVDFKVTQGGLDPLAQEGGYMEACQDALEYFNFPLPPSPTPEEEELNEACLWLRQLISDLNQSLVHFVSVAQYEAELNGSIMPLLDAKFDELDEGSAQVLTTFLMQYHGMVRYHAASQARKRVLEALLHVDKELGLSPYLSNNPTDIDGRHEPSDRHLVDEEESQPLQALALQWAMNRKGVSNTVVGMTSPEHVHLATGLARSFNML